MFALFASLFARRNYAKTARRFYVGRVVSYRCDNCGAGGDPRIKCSSNLKQIGLGLLSYSQDYDEHMPPVKLSNVRRVKTKKSIEYRPYGWADAVHSYIGARNTKIFHCPDERKTAVGNSSTQSGYTDYWFNSNLAEANMERISQPSRIIMAGDGNDGTDNTNARYSLNVLPQSWRQTEHSPARRHSDKGNYLFADGHVKAFSPEEINNLPTTQSSSTFSIR